LTVTGTGRSTWGLAPQFGDLTHAEAEFTTPLGKLSAAWTLVQGGYTVSWGAPAGTVGDGMFFPCLSFDTNLSASRGKETC
jgi:hypothetical protein